MAQVVAPAKKKLNPQQHIKVVCRIRPFSEQEHAEKIRNVLTVEGTTVIKSKEKRYQFDKVFRSDSTQMDIYLYVVSPMINDVLSGYNCTVFAYGQTGTGKTFTMTGGDRDFIVNNWREDPLAGCIPRAAANIFDQITSMGTATDYNVRVSFLELYNEEVRDLLSDDERSPPLNVLSDTKGTVCIQGLREITVNNRTDIFELLDKGTAKRQTAATLMNHHSSRSHTVFTITVHARETSVTGEDVLKTGKINLVDLAGSENIAKSGAKDQRALELANINKSLLTLGRVIQNLVDKVKHVPYRDSKLTRILQDSLGGHTKTCIIATVSGAHTSYEETVSTLDYASRARDIKNYPTINEKFTKAQMMKEMNKEIEKLKKDLDAARSGQGFYVDKDNWEHMQSVYTSVQLSNQEKQERIVSLEDRIAEMEEVMVQKLRSFDNAVVDSKKFKSICEKQKVVIKRQKLTIDREKFISDVYKETAEEKGKECVWLIEQYNDIQKDYFTLLTKVDSLYEINKINENLLLDTINRFKNVTCKIGKLSCKYSERLDQVMDYATMQRRKLQREQDNYYSYIDLARDSFKNLARPFEPIDAMLAAGDSPLVMFCTKIKNRSENDAVNLETVKQQLGDHQKRISSLVENLNAGMEDYIDDLKKQLETHFKRLGEAKRKNFEEEEKQGEKLEAALVETLEKFRKARADHKKHGEAEIQATCALSCIVVQELSQLQENTDASANIVGTSLNGDINPVLEIVKAIDVNKYHTDASDLATETLDLAKVHSETVRSVLGEVESMGTITEDVYRLKEESVSVSDRYQDVIDDFNEVLESYSEDMHGVVAEIHHFTQAAMGNVQPNKPTGKTPRATRTQMQHQGEAAPPPREALMKQYEEKNPPPQQLQDKENDLNLSNCSATSETCLDESASLENLSPPDLVVRARYRKKSPDRSRIASSSRRSRRRSRRRRSSSVRIAGSSSTVYYTDDYSDDSDATSSRRSRRHSRRHPSSPDRSFDSPYTFTDSSGSSVIVIEDYPPPSDDIEIPPFCNCPSRWPIEMCRCVEKRFKKLQAEGKCHLCGFPTLGDILDAGPSGTQKRVKQKLKLRPFLPKSRRYNRPRHDKRPLHPSYLVTKYPSHGRSDYSEIADDYYSLMSARAFTQQLILKKSFSKIAFKIESSSNLIESRKKVPSIGSGDNDDGSSDMERPGPSHRKRRHNSPVVTKHKKRRIIPSDDSDSD